MSADRQLLEETFRLLYRLLNILDERDAGSDLLNEADNLLLRIEDWIIDERFTR